MALSDAFTICGAGASLATSGTSARVAIPTDASGRPARFVVISVTASAFVRPGDSTVTAANTDMICNANEKTLLCVAGCTHLAGLQQGAAGSITIVPVQ